MHHGFAVACLFLSGLAHILAVLCGRGVDPAAIHLTAPLAAMPAMLLLARQATLPRAALLGLLAWVGWQAATLGCSPMQPSVGTARIAIDALALCLVFVCGSCPDPARLLRWFGWAAAAMLLLAVVAGLALRSPNLGFGVPNHLFACVVPPLTALAWLCWRQSRPWQRLLLAGSIALAIYWAIAALPGMPRRGALAALAAGLAAPLAWRLAWRYPRSALAAGLIAVAALVAGVALIADAPVGAYRTQRLGLWTAGLSGLAAWWPTGGGAWAGLHLDGLPLDGARIVVATGATMDDPHCLPLAVLLEGGVVAALIAVAGLVWAFRQRRPPGLSSDALLAMGAALLVLALIENAYSLPAPRLVLAACLGCLLAGRLAPVGQGGTFRTWPLALCAVLACLWLVWRESTLALLPRRPQPQAVMAAMADTCIPQLAVSAMDICAGDPGRESEVAYHLAGQGLRRFGPAQVFVRPRYLAIKRLMQAQRPGQGIDDAGRRMLGQEVGELAVRILHSDPFEQAPLQDLAAALAAGATPPGTTAWMQAAASAWLPGTPLPPTGSPMEQAACELAGIAARMATRSALAADQARLVELAGRYPDSPGLRRVIAGNAAGR